MDLIGKRHLQINRFFLGSEKERNKKMDKEKVNYNTGITFTGLLTVVFIALKLTGVITWSWWWVLSPIWIPWGIAIILVFIIAIIAAFRQKENSRK